MTFIYTLYGQKIVMVYNYYLIGGHIQRPCRSILPLVVIRESVLIVILRKSITLPVLVDLIWKGACQATNFFKYLMTVIP